MEQLELLWHLQEVDLAIKRNEEEMADNPLIDDVREAEADFNEKSAGLEETAAKVMEQEKALKRQDLDLQKIAAEAKSLSQKLYGGTVSSNRELEQMEKKLGMLEREKELLENRIIGQLEEVETLEEEREIQKKTLDEVARALEEKKKILDGRIKVLEEQVYELQARRRELIEKISPGYLEKYNVFSLKHRGRGMARVENDICGGCSVFIPSAHRGLLYNPNSMVYCENCGRLLVRLPEAKTGDRKEG